ncbi:MAG: hypothetical protein JNL36_10710 [Candidatus Kapabacteria bacterium]|nr:hypothetical protein [Candidatus Kapabacteria bacterium]
MKTATYRFRYTTSLFFFLLVNVSVLVVVGFVFRLVENNANSVIRFLTFSLVTLGMLSLSVFLARTISKSFYRIKQNIHTRSWNFLNKVTFISIIFGLLLTIVQIFTIEKYSKQLFGNTLNITTIPASIEMLKQYAFISVDSLQIKFSKRVEFTHLNKSNKSVKQRVSIVLFPLVKDTTIENNHHKIWVGYTYYGKDDNKYEDFVQETTSRMFLVETSENELFSKAMQSSKQAELNPDSLMFLRPIESKEENVFTLQSTFLLIYSLVVLLFAAVLFVYSKRMVYARSS